MSFRRMKAFRILRFARVAVVAIFLALPPRRRRSRVQTAPPGQSEFVPIKDLPPTEQLPAAPLLIAAYAFVWVAVLFYLWTIWRRLGKVEAEMRDARAEEPRAR